jgi:hypothetical protein
MYALMKMSVLFFYRRIFTSHQRFRTVNTFVIILIGLWSLAYMIAEIFVCGTTPQVLWTHGADPNAVCVNRNDLNFTYAISDVIGDILVVFMPFPVIRKLQMDRRQKIGVGLIFMLGTLSTICSILRLGFISVAFTKDYGAFGINIHMAGTAPSVWSTVEGAVGVLAACLPPLGPLIRRAPNARKASKQFYQRFMSRRSDGQTSQGSYPDQFHTPHGAYPTPFQTPPVSYPRPSKASQGSYPSQFGVTQPWYPPDGEVRNDSFRSDIEKRPLC